jgi:dTDP-glucose 4,6-dehydratase
MMPFQPANVLVTGGAGFIGCNYVRFLQRHDPAVRIVTLDALTTGGSLGNLRDLPDPARHRFVRGDILDGRLVASLLREHAIDTVIHFAAETHVDRSITGPEAFIRTNVLGTATLLEACRNCWLEEQRLDAAAAAGRWRFHHISTDEVYGSIGPADPPATEDTAFAPSSPYAASKGAADHLVRAWFQTFGLPVTVTVCSNNYGPRQHVEKLIPTVVRCCLEARPIPVYGDGLNVRDWLHVEDHCRAIELVIREGRVGERYHVGGGTARRNLDLVRLICREMDRLRPEGAPHERLIAFVADRPGHDRRYAIDWSKLHRELGWAPVVALDPGLAQTVRSYVGGGVAQPEPAP